MFQAPQLSRQLPTLCSRGSSKSQAYGILKTENEHGQYVLADILQDSQKWLSVREPLPASLTL